VDLIRLGGFSFFVADLFQLTGVQPVAAAIGALIHFDTAFGTKEMPMQLDAEATGTFAFAPRVDAKAPIALDLQERFPGWLVGIVHTLHLEGIKPDAATATLADIHSKIADLDFSQLVEAGWAFHTRTPFTLLLINRAPVGD
jgi:hypothetical protein